jgi:predicted alpha/beta superfamily hydrolase
MMWRRESEHDETGRAVHVALPEGYDEGTGRYPTIVCLDAQWTFGTVCDTALSLGLARLLPRVIVVGLGWDTDRAREVTRRRAAAYTPTEAVMPDFAAPGGERIGGGAGEHLAWMAATLRRLDDRYRTVAGERTLVGHSLSALFGLYCLFHQPDVCNRWLLASPSVWWDGRSILTIEAEQRRRGVERSGRVFMSVGSEEESLGSVPMITNARDVQRRLAVDHGERFDSTLVVLDGELHHSTIGAAVSRGLRWLYR